MRKLVHFMFSVEKTWLYYSLMIIFIFISTSQFNNASADILDDNDLTTEEVIEYLRTTHGIVDGSNELLEMLLQEQYPNTASSFLDAFINVIGTAEIINALYAQDYQRAILRAEELLLILTIQDTALGSILSSVNAIAGLATLPIDFALQNFAETVIKTAWNNQQKLYIRARLLGYSHEFIMEGVSDDNILFTDDGWLYIVGDLHIPPYGPVRPGDYTREQVYGAAQIVYPSDQAAPYHNQDEEKAVSEFRNLLSLGINYSPSDYASLSAPVNVSFSPRGAMLGELTIVSYEWDFGDGQSDVGETVSHFFIQPGNYTVTLRIQDTDGNTHVATQQIIIRPPTIEVSYPDGFDSLKRRFSTPASAYADKYQWNFGDGSLTSNSRTTNHTYAQSGYYTVTLTLTLDDDSTIKSTAGIFVGPGTRYIWGHTIYGEETWYAGGTYVVMGSVTVAAGGRLTIEPGTEVQLAGGVQIDVFGTLFAKDITFTWADGENEWNGIRFMDRGADGSRLENCVVEHTRGVGRWASDEPYNTGTIYIWNASPTISGCRIGSSSAPAGIWMRNSAQPTISGNTISGFVGGEGIGIKVDNSQVWSGSSPTVVGNSILNNRWGILVHRFSNGGIYRQNIITGNHEYGVYVGYSESSQPIVTNNSYSGNAAADLYVDGTIAISVVWDDGEVYRAGGLTIAQGGSLSIAAGRRVELTAGAEIRSYGPLTAAEVTFTWADGENEWNGIRFMDRGADGSRLENCVVEHTRGVGRWASDEPYNTGTIYIWNASPTISGCRIGSSSAPAGIWMRNSAQPTISGNTISGFVVGEGIGIKVDNSQVWSGSSPTVVGNSILNNRWGILVHRFSNGGIFQDNKITGNSDYGIYYSGTNPIDATNNDWGHPSGPRDDSDDRASGGFYNPNGQGDKVSNKINYFPWKNTDIGLTVIPVGQHPR